ATAGPTAGLRTARARTRVVHAHADEGGLAAVVVGLSVAAAHRIEHRRAEQRPVPAHSFGSLGALSVGSLAVLQRTAGAAAGSTADLRAALALACVVHAHPGSRGLASVAVGRCVAAAHRIDVRRANARLVGADAFGALGALSVGTLAVLVRPARAPASSTAGLRTARARATVVHAHADEGGLAAVVIGLSVAAAHRVEDRRAEQRPVPAH